MNNKNNMLLLFVLLALLQLFVPAYLIYNNERALVLGEKFNFKVLPIDPYDPFRGKYIVLNFEDLSLADTLLSENNIGDKVFAVVETNAKGFAKIAAIYPEEPSFTNNYFTTRIIGYRGEKFSIELPFNKFFMEESKAGPAEEFAREAAADSAKLIYAEVYIFKGNAVLSDVKIDNVSLKELLKK